MHNNCSTYVVTVFVVVASEQHLELGYTWTIDDRMHRSRREWKRCAEMAQADRSGRKGTGFKGRTPLLDLPYWDHRVIPTLGHGHILLFGLVKDFLRAVSHNFYLYFCFFNSVL